MSSLTPRAEQPSYSFLYTLENPIEENKTHRLDKDGFAIPFPVVKAAKAAGSAAKRKLLDENTPPWAPHLLNAGNSREEYLQAMMGSRSKKLDSPTNPVKSRPVLKLKTRQKEESCPIQKTSFSIRSGKLLSAETLQYTKRLKASMEEAMKNSEEHKKINQINKEWKSRSVTCFPTSNSTRES